MADGDAHAFPGFLTPVLTQLSFQSHRLSDILKRRQAKIRRKEEEEEEEEEEEGKQEQKEDLGRRRRTRQNVFREPQVIKENAPSAVQRTPGRTCIY